MALGSVRSTPRVSMRTETTRTPLQNSKSTPESKPTTAKSTSTRSTTKKATKITPRTIIHVTEKSTVPDLSSNRQTTPVKTPSTRSTTSKTMSTIHPSVNSTRVRPRITIVPTTFSKATPTPTFKTTRIYAPSKSSSSITNTQNPSTSASSEQPATLSTMTTTPSTTTSSSEPDTITETFTTGTATITPSTASNFIATITTITNNNSTAATAIVKSTPFSATKTTTASATIYSSTKALSSTKASYPTATISHPTNTTSIKSTTVQSTAAPLPRTTRAKTNTSLTSRSTTIAPTFTTTTAKPSRQTTAKTTIRHLTTPSATTVTKITTASSATTPSTMTASSTTKQTARTDSSAPPSTLMTIAANQPTATAPNARKTSPKSQSPPTTATSFTTKASSTTTTTATTTPIPKKTLFITTTPSTTKQSSTSTPTTTATLSTTKASLSTTPSVAKISSTASATSTIKKSSATTPTTTTPKQTSSTTITSILKTSSATTRRTATKKSTIKRSSTTPSVTRIKSASDTSTIKNSSTTTPSTTATPPSTKTSSATTPPSTIETSSSTKVSSTTNSTTTTSPTKASSTTAATTSATTFTTIASSVTTTTTTASPITPKTLLTTATLSTIKRSSTTTPTMTATTSIAKASSSTTPSATTPNTTVTTVSKTSSASTESVTKKSFTTTPTMTSPTSFPMTTSSTTIQTVTTISAAKPMTTTGNLPTATTPSITTPSSMANSHSMTTTSTTTSSSPKTIPSRTLTHSTIFFSNATPSSRTVINTTKLPFDVSATTMVHGTSDSINSTDSSTQRENNSDYYQDFQTTPRESQRHESNSSRATESANESTDFKGSTLSSLEKEDNSDYYEQVDESTVNGSQYEGTPSSTSSTSGLSSISSSTASGTTVTVTFSSSVKPTTYDESLAISPSNKSIVTSVSDRGSTRHMTEETSIDGSVGPTTERSFEPTVNPNIETSIKTTSKEPTTIIKSEPGINSDYYEEWERNVTTTNLESFTTAKWNNEEVQTSSERDNDVSRDFPTTTSSDRKGSSSTDSEKDATFGDVNTTVATDATDVIVGSSSSTLNTSPSDSTDFELFTTEPSSKDPEPTSTDRDSHSTEGKDLTTLHPVIKSSTTTHGGNIKNSITTTVTMDSSSIGSTLNQDSKELSDLNSTNTAALEVTRDALNTTKTSTFQPDTVAIWVSTTTSDSSNTSGVNEALTTTAPIGDESKSSTNFGLEATPNPDSGGFNNSTKPSNGNDSNYSEESGHNFTDSALFTTTTKSAGSANYVSTSSFSKSEIFSTPQEDSEQSSNGTSRSPTMTSTEYDDLFGNNSDYYEETEAKTTSLDFNSTVLLEKTMTTLSGGDGDSSLFKNGSTLSHTSTTVSSINALSSEEANKETSDSKTTSIPNFDTEESVANTTKTIDPVTTGSITLDSDSDYYQEVKVNRTNMTYATKTTPSPTKSHQSKGTFNPSTSSSTGKFENDTTDSPDYYEPLNVNVTEETLTIIPTGTTRSSLRGNSDSTTFTTTDALRIQSSTSASANQDDSRPSGTQNNNTKEFSDNTVQPDLPYLSNSNSSSPDDNSDYYEYLDSNRTDTTSKTPILTIGTDANPGTTFRANSSFEESFTSSSNESFTSQSFQESNVTQTTLSPKPDEFTRSTAFETDEADDGEVTTTTIGTPIQASTIVGITSESISTSIPFDDALINSPTTTVNLSTETPTTVENKMTGYATSNNESVQNSTQDYADYTEEIGDMYDFRNFTEPNTTPIKSVPGSTSVPTPLATTVDYVDDSPDSIGITDSNLTTTAPTGVSIKSDNPGLASNVTEEYYEYYELFDNTTTQIDNESATEQSSQVPSTTGRQIRSSEAHGQSNQASSVTVTVQDGFSVTLLSTKTENSSPVAPVVDSRSLDEEKTVKPQINEFPDVRGDFGDMTSTEVNDYLDAFNTTTSFEELLSTIFSLHHSTDPVEREKRNSEKPSPRSDTDESEETPDQPMDTTQNPASTILDDWFVDQFDTLLLPTSTTPFPETAVQIEQAEEPNLDEIRRLNTNDLSELGIHNSAQMDRLSRLVPQFKKSDSDKHRGVFVSFTDRSNGTKSGAIP